MSDQSRERKDEAHISEEQQEQQPEQSQAEAAQPVNPEPEDLQTQETQTEAPQTEEPQAKQDKTKKRQRIIMIAGIVLAVAAVIAMVLVLLYNRWVQKPNLPPTPGQTTDVGGGSVPSAAVPSLDPGPGVEATSGIDTAHPLAGGERRSEDFYTILIFGSDMTSGLTDTIMVASYDVTNQKAAVMSIPRDTLVNNAYLDKANMSINATYVQNGGGESGAAALKTEVSRLIGFVPDFYITINWELVGKMVDAIDGVEYEVPWRMKYDDPTQNLHIDLMPGLQTLNGDQAMQLVRWRQNNYGVPGGGDGSDLGRLDVQHDFLKAVMKQCLKPQIIVRIPELIRLFNENVVSDLAVENMLWFGQEAILGGISVDDVEFFTMPVYGTGNAAGRFYGKVCPVPDELLDVVNGSLNPYAEDVTMRQLDLLQMSADGNTLSATTGVLRNPSAGVYTPPYTPPPETSDGPETSEPTESEPGTTEPTESEPGTTQPSESNPGNTQPSESEPGTTQPSESNPGNTEPTESGPGATEPTESGPGTTQPTEGGPGATEPTESGPGTAEPTETNPGQADDPPPESGPSRTHSGT